LTFPSGTLCIAGTSRGVGSENYEIQRELAINAFEDMLV
jgi:hypothetical protein